MPFPRLFLYVILLGGIFFNVPVLAFVSPSAISSKALAELTNENRASSKVQALKVNSLLDKAAEMKAKDMAEKGYFSHVSSDGKNSWYWLDKAGYAFSYAGENLAVNFFDSRDIAEAWMKSASHRENILNKNVTEIGTGLAEGKFNGRETVYVAQFFAKPFQTNIVKPALAGKDNGVLLKLKYVRKTKTIKAN